VLVANAEVWVVLGGLQAGEVEGLGCGGVVVDEVCGRGERSVCVVFMVFLVFEIVQSGLDLFPGGLHRERVVEVVCVDERAE